MLLCTTSLVVIPFDSLIVCAAAPPATYLLVASLRNSSSRVGETLDGQNVVPAALLPSSNQCTG